MLSHAQETKGFSEFLVSRLSLIESNKLRKGFTISDPPKNTRNGAEFLIPKERGKSLRISDPPKNTEEVPEFLIP